MGEFRETFETYGGDYRETLDRFLGDESLYLRILDMLFQDKNLDALRASLQSGDLAAAFEAAHTLKGVTGNLGLAPLYEAVCHVVEPLRAGEQRGDYGALCRAVEEEFERARELRDRLKGGRE